MVSLTLVAAADEKQPEYNEMERIESNVHSFELFAEAMCQALRGSLKFEDGASVPAARSDLAGDIVVSSDKLAAVLGPALDVVAGDWLRARTGRSINLRIDDSQVLASTLDGLFKRLELRSAVGSRD